MTARAVIARQFRFLTSTPHCWARRSMVRNPKLCGVNWYSIPGLPRPTISFTRVSSWLLAASYQRLFLLFLLRLLGLLRCSFLGTFAFDFLLALLDDLGLGRSDGSLDSGGFRCRRHFFLDRYDVYHGLVRVRKELQFFSMRQVRHAQHLAEYQSGALGVDVARDIAGQALDFDLAQHLLQNAALLFHARRFALEDDRNQDLELLVHGNTFEVDVQQRAFDRFVLPIDDHSLAALAIQGQIENSVVTSLGVENAGHLPRIHADRHRVLAGAVDHRGNLSAAAHSAGMVLIARLARLRFQKIDLGFRLGCCSHNFDSCLHE